MSRQERRREQRAMQKMENRTFTWDEVKHMVSTMEKEIITKYNVRYTLALATCLSEEPFNFGKKRVCNVVNLFFDQIEGLRLGTISDEQIAEVAARLGITAKYEDGLFIVDIDPDYKNGKHQELKNIYIGVKK